MNNQSYWLSYWTIEAEHRGPNVVYWNNADGELTDEAVRIAREFHGLDLRPAHERPLPPVPADPIACLTREDRAWLKGHGWSTLDDGFVIVRDARPVPNRARRAVISSALFIVNLILFVLSLTPAAGLTTLVLALVFLGVTVGWGAFILTSLLLARRR